MNRKAFPISLVALLVALLAGPASFARTAHDHPSPGPSAHSSKAPRPEPAGRVSPYWSTAPARGGYSSHYLILVPDFFDFGYPAWDAGFYWGWPYYYPPYRYGTWYGPGFPYNAEEGYVEVNLVGSGTALDLHVRPHKAEVRLDGEPIGQVRDYDDWSSRLSIAPGKHVLEMDAPGYRSLRLDLSVERGRFYSLHYRLKKGKGLDPRSARDPRVLKPPVVSQSRGGARP